MRFVIASSEPIMTVIGLSLVKSIISSMITPVPSLGLEFVTLSVHHSLHHARGEDREGPYPAYDRSLGFGLVTSMTALLGTIMVPSTVVIRSHVLSFFSFVFLLTFKLLYLFYLLYNICICVCIYLYTYVYIQYLCICV